MLAPRTQRLFELVKKSIGYILFLICAISIYREVTHYQHIEKYGKELKSQFLQIHWTCWILLLALMLLNFIIETIKWKWVLSIDTPISFKKAFASVFVGQALAFYTPNRLGDYVGRTIMLEEGDKKMALAKVGWVSYAQLIITIMMGAIALFIKPYFATWLQWAMPLTVLLALLIYYTKINFKGKWVFLNRFQIDSSIKSVLLILSLCRYLIFILQYAWAASMLGIQIPLFELMTGVAILFLTLSVLPTISYTEWVVRGQIITMLFASWCSNSLLLIALATMIWCVNLVLPAIIGAFLLLGFKLKR